ncbi:MAG: A/G-specific adenine glycosylase [Lachnospiraceae bacterium]|nr:A/G-specific adenine glycosylase [Lachnospiraceae bacterium]
MGEKICDTEEAEVRQRMAAMPEPLLAWYASARRELPWRISPSPYRVWISEIMLQQTRIEVVRGYYERFLAAFPDVNALADAEETRVLKLWEGLGYYSRARNLMRAARVCRDEYGGDLPKTYEELRALPGIGSYTAGAIGSIALGLSVPAVDGNVFRVVMRYLADDSDISRASVRRCTEERIRAVLPPGQAGVFNQAIMELGETVCVPGGRPLCASCPLAASCLAREQGNPEAYPVRPVKKARAVEEKTILVISCGNRYAIHRRPEEGLLAGMYELPWLPGKKSRAEMEEWMAEKAGDGELMDLPEARHIFSHIEWHMTGWRIALDEEIPGEWFFEEAETIRREYPLPTAFRAYAAHIQ